ncbi:hypothetical protein [Phaeacidiphilus oryzae]|uniref:hypothetical protein n=1 Tax=Phaeacidiphilus oryzae TaxID=348818 RepID=UPI000AEA24DB|nr:hypothetical protein [Phaeacidiphilus oryzae]
MTDDMSENAEYGAGRHYVRLQIELIAEITDQEALARAAVERVRDDETMDPEERAEALQAVELDPTGAVAHFVDPVELLGDVPGVQLAQAAWETERVEYDPDDEEWDLLDFAEADDDYEDDDGSEDDAEEGRGEGR